MEAFFLDPNIAYLFLVAGMFLALMAMLTPGTGLFEVSSLFALIFAGWAVYRLEVNYWALAVLILGVIPFVIAVRKAGQWVYLAISILALMIGSAFLFRGEVWWQPAVNPLLALFVSLLTGGFLWLITRKTIEASLARPSHDLSALLGAIGEAKTDIHSEGSLQVAGELWSAFSDKAITEGSRVRVIGREGFLLKVEAVEENEE